MNFLCTVLVLLSFLLFATITESRMGAGGYKEFENAIERRPQPENLWELMKEQLDTDNVNVNLSDDKDEKTDCRDGNALEMADDEVYNIDTTEVTKSSNHEKNPESSDDEVYEAANAFYEDFEPGPYISVYNN
ncbi:uncharacterized protein LOC126783847 [Argentina anserina]|uniref:uncharacterized protein LOC126783847 n=1 Tax=Argentina anserina TaxID=57926 RepID=UPI00217657AC|nr:uncharacterized protein LOC126783847 [Potentilla anserina]